MTKTLTAIALLLSTSVALAQETPPVPNKYALTSTETEAGTEKGGWLPKPIALPGSNWSVLSYPSGAIGAERENVLLQGRIEQGADWVRFGEGKNWVFNTYVDLGYSADSQELTYNNKLVPGIGAKISRRYADGVVDFGVRYFHQYNWVGQNESAGSFQAYVSYWFGWDLSKKR
jgi:hypothetical protein